MATVNETSVDREARILEEIKLVEGSNLWSFVLRRMKRSQMGMIGFYLVTFLIALAVVAFLIQQYDAYLACNNDIHYHLRI